MKIPDELKYTKDHEWVETTDEGILLGITDFAQDQLGDITYVDFQVEEGDEIEAGDVFATVESVKTASDCYSPISGKIEAINTDLEDSPENVNEAPYGAGWLIRMDSTAPEEMDELLGAEEYAELLSEEE